MRALRHSRRGVGVGEHKVRKKPRTAGPRISDCGAIFDTPRQLCDQSTWDSDHDLLEGAIHRDPKRNGAINQGHIPRSHLLLFLARPERCRQRPAGQLMPTYGGNSFTTAE